ncbi:hypothetical protein Tco_0632313 [Tanacetum coccineum]
MRDVAGIRSQPPPNIKKPDWDTQIDYWLDPKNATQALKNAKNQAKSKVFCRQGSRSLAVHRDMQDEARVQYEEMLRLGDLGANMPTGVPYTEDQIMSMVRKGKQRGHIPSVGRVLAGLTGTSSLSTSFNARTPPMSMRSDDRMSQLLTQLESQHGVGGGSGSDRGGNDEPVADEDAGGDEDADGDEES